MTAEQHPNNVVAISRNAIFLQMKKKIKFVSFSLFCFLNLTVLTEIAEMKLKDESQLVEITIKFKHHVYQLCLKYQKYYKKQISMTWKSKLEILFDFHSRQKLYFFNEQMNSFRISIINAGKKIRKQS